MTGHSVSDTEVLLQGWYEKHPELFDSEDNKLLFRFYLEKFLGLPINPVAQMRLDAYSWGTIERTVRLMVSKGKIQMSEENKKERHIESEKTKAAIKKKEPIDYNKLYKLENGRYVPR